MFQSDYIMREIEGLTRMLAKTIFHKDLNTREIIDEQLSVSGTDLLLQALLRMVSEGRVNDAENLLHEHLAREPRPEYLAVAVRFYAHLDGMSDEELARCDFSRGEIAQGLADVRRYCGREPEGGTP